MSQATLRVIARLVARAGKEDALRSVLMGRREGVRLSKY
jgi:hypothetical protein